MPRRRNTTRAQQAAQTQGELARQQCADEEARARLEERAFLSREVLHVRGGGLFSARNRLLISGPNLVLLAMPGTERQHPLSGLLTADGVRYVTLCVVVPEVSLGTVLQDLPVTLVCAMMAAGSLPRLLTDDFLRARIRGEWPWLFTVRTTSYCRHQLSGRAVDWDAFVDDVVQKIRKDTPEQIEVLIAEFVCGPFTLNDKTLTLCDRHRGHLGLEPDRFLVPIAIHLTLENAAEGCVVTRNLSVYEMLRLRLPVQRMHEPAQNEWWEGLADFYALPGVHDASERAGAPLFENENVLALDCCDLFSRCL